MIRKHRAPNHLLEEAYLFILTRRPAESTLAKDLRIQKQTLGGVLRDLSHVLKEKGLRLVATRRSNGRAFQISAIAESDLKTVSISPVSLKAMSIPPRRTGLKPEDEVIYARDW